MIKFIVISYLVVSFFLAVSYIIYELEYANDMASVPEGDLEYYEKRPHLLERVWILFPVSIMIVLLIILFVTLARKVLD